MNKYSIKCQIPVVSWHKDTFEQNRERDNLIWKLYNYFIARALPYYIFQIKPASKILPPLHSTLQRHLRKSTNFTIPQ